MVNLFGNVMTSNGTLVEGPMLSTESLDQLRQLVNSGVSVTDAMKQVKTANYGGVTLAQALDQVNAEVKADGGYASPHVSSEFTASDVANLLNSSAGNTTYGTGSGTPAPSSNNSLNVPIWLVVVGVLFFFMIWQSNPTTTLGGGKSKSAAMPRTLP